MVEDFLRQRLVRTGDRDARDNAFVRTEIYNYVEVVAQNLRSIDLMVMKYSCCNKTKKKK
jgi:hypothetical protein